MKTLVVEKSKILSNLEVIKEQAGKAQVIAVLKANAYGLGLLEMAGLCREAGIRRFAVTEPEDAMRLRDWGFGEEEILVLRSTANADEVKKILQAGATATVGSYDAALALNGLAESQGMMCDVHVKVDTGMGRYGFLPTEIDRILSVFRYLTNLNVTGTYTHYANAFKSAKKTQEQLDAFNTVVEKIRAAGFEPGMLHASNSEAMFGCKTPNLDAVRIGSALGGRVIAKGDHGLQRTGKLQSQITEVRWLPTGAPVGYGSAYVTKHPTRVAVIPIGSADGYMLEKTRTSTRFRDCIRAACSSLFSIIRKKKYYVLVGGKRAPVIGHVGVNHTTIDVTDIECAPGTTVLLDAAPLYVPASIPRQYVD
ncbi:MAG: alanine racemase [Clostridia bacterium]|nr:alanine racemase [Clostridia bacterium]